MKAIPMKGRLKGKRLSGYVWAGPGMNWRRKENYFQLEHAQLVSAVVGSQSGSFWVRCKGATCEITLKGPKDEVLGKIVLALPRGRRK